MESKIFLSTIIHKRFLPFKHKFKYIVPSLYISLNELDKLKKSFKLFSVNSFNIFSFFEKDHGFRDKRSIEEFVTFYLKKYEIDYDKLNIRILCFPRILGYVFNPISIIFCYDHNKLIAILYEVKNTSNEQHTYCFIGSGLKIKSVYKHSCKKIFYVSPFIDMDTYYKFTTKIPSNKLSILIQQFNKKNRKILIASQNGTKIDFNSLTIMVEIKSYPVNCDKLKNNVLFCAIQEFYSKCSKSSNFYFFTFF